MAPAPRSTLFPYTTLFRSLAERLSKTMPGAESKKVFFTNSGTEAIEGAIKLARYATKRDKMVEEKDRKSTRLNSSHGYISYAVFCLKKKINENMRIRRKSA